MFELSRCSVFSPIFLRVVMITFLNSGRRNVVISRAPNAVRIVIGCFFHRLFFLFRLLEHKNQRGFTKQMMCLKIKKELESNRQNFN
jgi:hypothetical protein